MKLTIEAACGCNKGKIRSKNEDNFYFDGKCLELNNEGLRNPALYEEFLKSRLCMAIFDGMGGENFGDIASYTAAQQMLQTERSLADFIIGERQYLERLTRKINDAVVSAANECGTDRMGSTMVALFFSGKHVYSCNLGDSRAYRLRNGEFLQISHDHVETRSLAVGRKAPLTQHLGINPEDMLIEPYIAKDKVFPGDQYLLCSDGLTDMLTNFEISDIMLSSEDAESCVSRLINAALEHGGRDNITVIICRIK